MAVSIRHIFISPGHNFFGRHGKSAGEYPIVDLPVARCRAGWGLEGDRFYGYRPEYSGQITFFSWETYEAVKHDFRVPALSPASFRRNILIEGVDLNTLIGRRFSIDGLDFEGTGEARPCHWMNTVVAAGAEDWLKGRGGLRAKILTDGHLTAGSVALCLFQEVT